jgi:hypothetical protein
VLLFDFDRELFHDRLRPVPYQGSDLESELLNVNRFVLTTEPPEIVLVPCDELSWPVNDVLNVGV